MALTNDFKVKNGLTVVSSITAGGNLSASEGYFIDNLGVGTNPTGDTKFSVDGDSGNLFSVTDAVTGIVFSVNDAAGLPILEVESTATNDTITIGEYSTNAIVVSGACVGLGGATNSYTLDVTGDVNASTNILSGGVDLADIFATASGNITGVTAGFGLTGGGTDGDVTLDAVGGDGIITSADAICVDSTVVRTTGDQTIAGVKNFTGDICVGSNIYHNGDTDTRIIFDADRVRTLVGNETLIDAFEGTQDYVKLGDGGDVDINLNDDLFVQGSSGCVGIGTSTPSHKLDVESADDTVASFNSTDNKASIAINDDDTTVYVSAENGKGAFGFQSGAHVNNLNIDSSGNVGIGTNSPASNVKLHVVGTGRPILLDSNNAVSITKIANSATGNGTYNGLDLVVNSTANTSINSYGMPLIIGTSSTNGTNTTEAMRIATDGNVGIGTANPTSKIHIEENSGRVRIGSPTTSYGGIGFAGSLTAANAAVWGTATTTIIGAANSGSIEMKLGNDAVGNGSLKMQTDKLYYTGGNFGIGTTSPSAKLDVTGGNILISDTANDKYFGSNVNLILNADADGNSGDAYRNIIFQNRGSETARIDVSGNVGIGTTSPSEKLHVAGDSLVTGNSTIYGNLSVTGDFTCIETTVSTTSALSVTNTGTGPALYVCQAGSQPIAHFIDANGDDIVFNDNGCVGIGTLTPTEKLEVAPDTNSSAVIGRAHIGHMGHNDYAGFSHVDTNAHHSYALLQSNNGVTYLNASNSQRIYFLNNNSVVAELDANKFQLRDSKCLALGTDNDFQIYHNGTDSAIDNATNDFYISQKAADKDLIFRADDGAGGFETYFFLDGSEGVVNFPDSKKLTFGASRDLEIYHSGTESKINNDVGNLSITNFQDDGDIIFQSDNGSGGVVEYLRLDGSTEQNVVSKNMRFEDNIQAQFGAGSDLRIYHNGSNSYIDDTGTGSLYIRGANDVNIRKYTGEQMIKAIADGAVELYYDNSNKLQTTNSGINVCGSGTFTSTINGTQLCLAGPADTMIDLNQTGTDTGWSYINFKTLGTRNYYVGQDNSKNFNIFNDNIDVTAISVGFTNANVTLGADLTVSGGGITLGGTGRIQGVDTVSSGTDAANKTYVDCAVAGCGSGTVTSVTAGTGMTQTGTSTINPTLNVIGGDGITANADNIAIDTGVVMNLASAQTITGTKNFSGDICVGNAIYHSGDSNTYQVFNTDAICFYTGGEQHIKVSNGGVVINENSADNDFRVEGNNDAYALFLDASSDNVGIGVSVPGEKLTVAGNLSASGTGFVDKLGIGAEPSGDEVLTVDGTNGNLFTITDSVTGTVFAVSDSAGLPILEAYTDSCDMITMGEYGSNALVVCDTKVGVGTATPNEALTVVGSVSATCFKKAGGTSSQFLKADGSVDSASYTTCDGTVTSVTAGAGMTQTGSSTVNPTLNVIGDSSITVSADSLGVASACNTKWDQSGCSGLTCNGTVDTSGTPVDNDFAKFTDANTIEGRSCSEVRSDLGIGTAASCDVGDFLAVNGCAADSNLLDGIDSSAFLRSNANDSASGTINFTGDICVGDQIFHTGDADTYLRFGTNAFCIYTGNEQTLCSSGAGIVINETGTSNDFRVESNTNDHMLFVDGSADKVGIGCATPGQTLTVAGSALFTGDATVNGNLCVLGDFTCMETTVSVTSAMDITNHGSGPALLVNQTGSNDIVNFQDDGTSAFYIEDGGNVGINDTNPGHRLDVNGNINATGSYKLDDSDVINSSKVFVGSGIVLADGEIANFGSTCDLKIYHNCSNSLIEDGGTGSLLIRTDSLCVQNASGTESMLRATQNGAISLYYDSGNKFETTSAGVSVTGNIAVTGTVDGVDVAALATCSGLTCNGTVDTSGTPVDNDFAKFTDANTIEGRSCSEVRSDLGIGTAASCAVADFATAAQGTKADNALPKAGGTMTGNAIFNDNVELRLGTSSDFKAFHDGSNSYLQNVTGDLYIQNGANDKDVILRSDDGSGGQTEYFRLDGGDTRTVFSKAIKLEDDVNICLGTSSDFRLQHASGDSNSYIDNYTGSINIRNFADDKDITFQSDDGCGGITTYFQLDGSAELNRFAKNVMYNDNVVNYFGGGFDLQIYHNSTDSIISNGTGNLHIINSADDKDVVISSDNGAGGTTTYFRADGSTGSASMAHYGTTKLATTCSGINVCGDALITGHVCATTKSFVIDNPTTDGKLRYSVVEGNEHGVTVRGSTCSGTIELPDEWDWLVDGDSVTAQLTPVGGPHQPYVVSQDNKQVVVCSEGCYNYNIYGTRKDVEPLEVNI